MRYTLLVLTPPDAGSSPRHALQFARAAVGAGHDLLCVFFYDAGALTALAAGEAAQDEADIRAQWQAFAVETGTPLFACVASAARFGVSDGNSGSVREGFEIAGLGELVDAQHRADRLLTFGG